MPETRERESERDEEGGGEGRDERVVEGEFRGGYAKTRSTN